MHSRLRPVQPAFQAPNAPPLVPPVRPARLSSLEASADMSSLMEVLCFTNVIDYTFLHSYFAAGHPAPQRVSAADAVERGQTQGRNLQRTAILPLSIRVHRQRVLTYRSRPQDAAPAAAWTPQGRLGMLRFSKQLTRFRQAANLGTFYRRQVYCRL